MSKDNIIITPKCLPDKTVLRNIKKAGFAAVELYVSGKILHALPEVIQRCKNFPFRYAVHAPNDEYDFDKLANLVKAIAAEIVIFHNIYWEDEWGDIVKIFKNIKTKLCVENTFNIHEPVKFMRRYGLGCCLDLEHLQMQCAGVFEEVFIRAIKEASHIHLTGYIYGSQLWHSHIHHSPEHSLYMLNLLKKAGYSGFAVSEARNSLQTYEEFKKLNQFYVRWRKD